MWLWIHKVFCGFKARELRREIKEFYQAELKDRDVCVMGTNLYFCTGTQEIETGDQFYRMRTAELRALLGELTRYRAYLKAVLEIYPKGNDWIHVGTDGYTEVDPVSWLLYYPNDGDFDFRLQEIKEYVSQCRPLTELELEYRNLQHKHVLFSTFLPTSVFYSLRPIYQEDYLSRARKLTLATPPDSLTDYSQNYYLLIDGVLRKIAGISYSDGRVVAIVVDIAADGTVGINEHRLKSIVAVNLETMAEYIKIHLNLPEEKVSVKLLNHIRILLKLDSALKTKVLK